MVKTVWNNALFFMKSAGYLHTFALQSEQELKSFLLYKNLLKKP